MTNAVEKSVPRILRQGDRLADFIVLGLIGQGGFGNIYYVESKLTPGEYHAMKTESIECKHNGILNERRILQQIQGTPYFPRYVDFGHTILYRYLVMEFLGPSLSDMRRVLPGRHFSLSTALHVGVHALRAIQALHERGIVHRDVKPSNFLIRFKSRTPIVLIDFGLGRRYISRTDNAILPPRDRAGFVGTTKYASLNAHDGLELGRRDDLMSWLFELMTGALPWPASRDRAESYAAKRDADIAAFCARLPGQIRRYTMICKCANSPMSRDMIFSRNCSSRQWPRTDATPMSHSIGSVCPTEKSRKSRQWRSWRHNITITRRSRSSSRPRTGRIGRVR
jgi:serine/threonine protein kinase